MGSNDKKEVFDVFLSHNSREKPAVRQIAKLLRREKITPWLDAEQLTPGAPWQVGLEEGLAASSSVAVFIGPSGFSSWHEKEMRTVIARQTEHMRDDFRVIPVLLPGAGGIELPDFLTSATWVVFEESVEDEKALQRLVWGIRGQKISDGQADPALTGHCPFRGFENFEAGHAPFFFGRDAELKKALETLRISEKSKDENRFLALIGPSQSGKTSLAQAGLVASLQKGHHFPYSDRWPVLTCQPGTSPLQTLTAVLSHDTTLAIELSERENFLKNLRENEHTLHLHVQSRLKREKFVLVVDPFEELFTLCEDETERRSFVDNLVYAATALRGKTLIILVMRTHFLNRCASFAPLYALIKEHHVRLVSMNNEERRKAIEGPVFQVSFEYERGLTEILLHESRDAVSGLPILQDVLLRLWKKSVGRRLTQSGYRDIGGIPKLLEMQAETLYESFSPEEKGWCRRLCLRLLQVRKDAPLVCRRASLWELLPGSTEEQPFARRILQVLSEAHLLSIDGPSTFPDALVEIQSHEDSQFVAFSYQSFPSAWPRLRTWLEEERDLLYQEDSLMVAVREWKAAPDDQKSAHLLLEARLEQAEMWEDSHIQYRNLHEQRFLDDCRNLREKRRLQREQELQQREEVLHQMEAALEKANVANSEKEEAIARSQNWLKVFFLASIFVIALLALLIQKSNRSQQRAEIERKNASKTQQKVQKTRKNLEVFTNKVSKESRNLKALETILKQIITKKDGLHSQLSDLTSMKNIIQNKAIFFSKYFLQAVIRVRGFMEPQPGPQLRKKAAEILFTLAGQLPGENQELLQLYQSSNCKKALTSSIRSSQRWLSPMECYFHRFLNRKENADIRSYAAASLGKMGTSFIPRLREALVEALDHKKEKVQQAAAMALGRLGKQSDEAFLKLKNLLAEPHDKETYIAVILALGKMGPRAQEAIPELLALFPSKEAKLRRTVIWALGKLQSQQPSVLKAIEKALIDLSEEVRETASKAASELGSAALVLFTSLLKSLKDPSQRVRYETAELLGTVLDRANKSRDKSKVKRAIEALRKLINDRSNLVQQAASKALERIGPHSSPNLMKALGQKKASWVLRYALSKRLLRFVGESAIPVLLLAVSKRGEGDWLVRSTAVEALGNLGVGISVGGLRKAVNKLCDVLDKEKDWYVKGKAAKALGKLHRFPKIALPALQKALNDSEWFVRLAAANALFRFGKQARPAFQALALNALTYSSEEVRAAAVKALGVFGPSSSEVLLKALLDPSSKVREAAISSIAGFTVLSKTLQSEMNRFIVKGSQPQKRRAFARILGLRKVTSPQTLKALMKAATKDSDWDVRQAAVIALGKGRTTTKEVVDTVICALLEESDERVRLAAAKVLGKLSQKDMSIIKALHSALSKDTSIEVRREAALSFGQKLNHPIQSILYLFQTFQQTNTPVIIRLEIVKSLGKLKKVNKELLVFVQRQLFAGSKILPAHLRQALVYFIGNVEGHHIFIHKLLLAALASSDAAIRRATIKVLDQKGFWGVQVLLLKGLSSPYTEIREAANKCLRHPSKLRHLASVLFVKSSPLSKNRAVALLGRSCSSEALIALQKALHPSHPWFIQARAALAIGHLGLLAVAYVPLLRKIAKNEARHPVVRLASRNAITLLLPPFETLSGAVQKLQQSATACFQSSILKSSALSERPLQMKQVLEAYQRAFLFLKKPMKRSAAYLWHQGRQASFCFHRAKLLQNLVHSCKRKSQQEGSVPGSSLDNCLPERRYKHLTQASRALQRTLHIWHPKHHPQRWARVVEQLAEIEYTLSTSIPSVSAGGVRLPLILKSKSLSNSAKAQHQKKAMNAYRKLSVYYSKQGKKNKSSKFRKKLYLLQFLRKKGRNLAIPTSKPTNRTKN